MNLIVNPLATIDRDEYGELVSGGPVPGRGMTYLHISEFELPKMFSLFQELSTIGLAHLNFESDLNEIEIELLRCHGILIDDQNVPDRPLFSCMLDDVERKPAATGSLRVNPTLEFQPFDLTNFRTWIRDKHLSPHFSSVWVTDPRTEMRWGYWLTPEQASLVAELKAGEPPPNDIDDATRDRLLAASVLLDAEDNSPKDLSEKAREFAERRYTVLDDVIPPAQLRALQSYYRQYVDQGFMRFGDEQVPRRFAEHGEHVASMIQINLQPVMQKVVGAPLRRTYTHSAVYAEGAELEPHWDRELCEYSFSFQVDYEPALNGDVSPWPLYLAVSPPPDLNVDPKRDRAIHLRNGECLAYKGREIVHYRTPLPEGHRSTSLFFHYIPA